MKTIFFLIFASVLALICDPVQAQIDIRGSIVPWRGNQRPSGGGSGNSGSASQSPAQIAQDKRLNEADSANNRGLDYYKNQDWANAVESFQYATDKNPDDEVIKDNLEKAKEQLRAQQQKLLVQQQNKAAVTEMQQGMQTFSQTLKPVPSSDALDFISDDSKPISGTANPQPKRALEFGDPMVVDARNVTTCLPKDVLDAIPQTPAGDRVRKGFEAIQTHDWKVALAWFQDALNKEPGDPGLKRLVDLAKYTIQKQSKSSKPSSGSNVSDEQASKAMKTLDNALDDKMSADLSKALDDFYHNYLPKHPELMKDAPSGSGTKFLKQEDPTWIQFFRYLTPAPTKPSKSTQNNDGGIRG